MEFYPYIKSFHIIFMVTWFAGLFYIVRLFIYQTEVMEKSNQEKAILAPFLGLMAKRLWYIITWPSAIITLILGFLALYFQSWHLEFTYMWVKLGFVVLLYFYHIYCHIIYRKLQEGKFVMSSEKLRIWNEGATVLLIAIVLLIVVKTALSFIWGIVGMLGLALILMMMIKMYKTYRKRHGED